LTSGLPGAVAVDVEVGVDRQHMLDLQPRGGFGDRRVGQVEGQVGKTFADAQHVGQAAVDRTVQREAPRCTSTVELLLEHQPRVLAQRVELDLGPVVLHGAQLAGVFQQHGGCVHRVQRHAVAVAVDEALQLLRRRRRRSPSAPRCSAPA
jgi:hypothetical protein